MTRHKLTAEAQRFLDFDPKLLAITAGARWYEHPLQGDEVPLVAILPDGRVFGTTFWDVPDGIEAAEWLAEQAPRT